MQQANPPRSNRERTETTRHALVAAARALFVQKGYARTSTPEIVAATGLTRGALYHHFEDKKALFRAVVEAEEKAVAEEIEIAASEIGSARQALLKGSAAYLDAMRVPGRSRLLLVEGPAVLGTAGMAALDAAHAGRTLREGIEAMAGSIGRPGVSMDALSMLLSAAFDRAALAVAEGEDPAKINAAMVFLIKRVTGPDGQ